MKDNFYWLTIMWIVCETLYLYGYSKAVPSRSSCEDTHRYYTSTCSGGCRMRDKGGWNNGDVDLCEDLMVIWCFCYSVLRVIRGSWGAGAPPAPLLDPPLSTCISWWLCFTSHGHVDVKLIMWAHVGHESELTQHEMMTSHYIICTMCPKTWDRRVY